MPTVRPIKTKTRGTRWRAEVWVNNVRDSDRFDTKAEAVSWGLKREAELARDGRLVPGQTVAAAMDEYGRKVSATKKGHRAELIRLRRMKRDPIADLMLHAVRLDDGEDYRDRRLEQVGVATVIRELVVLKAVLHRCVRWRWLAVYPWKELDMPPAPRSRSRVYSPTEVQRILDTAGVGAGEPPVTRLQQTAVAFAFATETAMRQAEIAGLDWADVDTAIRVANLHDTKNGDPRDVPLSTRALELFQQMPTDQPRPWPMTPNVMSLMFTKLRRRCGIDDGTFHDARRTACTRLARKLGPMDLAKVSGHKNLTLLLAVYYEPDAADLARLLD